MKRSALFGWVLVFHISLFSQEGSQVLRYATGTYLVDKVPRDGLGELTIRNEIQNWDAVAVLTLPDTTIVWATYIRANDKVQIKGIRDGTYHLWFALGKEWDPQAFRFKQDATYERFESEFAFETIENSYSIVYSSFEVTLYRVLHGNARTEKIPSALFPKPVP